MPAEKSKVTQVLPAAPYGISRKNIIKSSKTRSSLKQPTVPSFNPDSNIEPQPNSSPKDAMIEDTVGTKKSVPKRTIKQRIDESGYDIANDMLDRTAGISFKQLFHIIPSLQTRFNKTRKSRIKQFVISSTAHPNSFNNMNQREEDEITALRCTMKIENVGIETLIDCGASRTIITKGLADRLGYSIDASSTTKFVLGNNKEYASLGVIYDIPINVNGLIVPITVEVLPEMPYALIIGNNWLQRTKAIINFNLTKMRVTYKQQHVDINIAFTKETSQQVTDMMNKTNSALDFLIPEYDEEESDEEEDEEDSDSSESETSEEDLVVLTNDFYCMTTKEDSRVHYNNNRISVTPGDNLIIPAQSTIPIHLNIPQKSSPQYVEINPTFENYLMMSIPVFDQNEYKFRAHLRNLTDEPIELPEKTWIAELEEIDLLCSYEVNSNLRLTETSADDSNQEKQLSKEQLDQVNIGEITEELKKKFLILIANYEDIFDWDGKTLGRTDLVYHKIITEDEIPIRTRPYRISPEESIALKEELDKHCKLGIIRPSESAYAAPIILVKKKDTKSYRVVINYKKLNEKTKKDAFPLPRIDDLLDQLGTSTVFSALDMRTAFHQIPMDPASQEKTAFVTKFGTFEYNTMPMGLCNSPSSFSRLMMLTFKELLNQCVVSYLDDQNIYSKSHEQHLKDIAKVFQCIRVAKLVLNPSKCNFFKDSLSFLGYIVSKEGISTDPKKVEKLVNYPQPKTVTEIKSFVALASYYRRYVAGFAKIARPLHELTKTKKGITNVWTDQANQSFETLKKALTEAPILMRPNFDKPFILMTDASRNGLGGVLSQYDEEGKERVILYISRGLKQAEENYGVSKLELLAVKWCVEKLRPYLLGSKFTVLTDHSSLRGILNNTTEHTGILARWVAILNEYEFDIIYRPGRVNENADFFSRLGY